jgi:hypothetical protein
MDAIEPSPKTYETTTSLSGALTRAGTIVIGNRTLAGTRCSRKSLQWQRFPTTRPPSAGRMYQWSGGMKCPTTNHAYAPGPGCAARCRWSSAVRELAGRLKPRFTRPSLSRMASHNASSSSR